MPVCGGGGGLRAWVLKKITFLKLKKKELKEPNILPNIATNLSKNNDLANSFKKFFF